MDILEAQDLHYTYPGSARAALERAELRLRAGESACFLGPNGAGKSTLLRLMAGLLPPGKGKVLWEGKDLSRVPIRERARRIAFLPQSVHFAFPLRAGTLVEMGRHPHLGRFRPLGPEDRRICDRALRLCDALPLKDRPFEALSGGEQQRVLLASALAQTPRALLLDEPTHSLDLSHQGRLLSILDRLKREEGLTILCATHDLNFLARSMDRVVLVQEGRIVEQGSPSRVLTVSRIQALYGVPVEAGRVGKGDRFFLPRIRKKGGPI